MGDMCMGADEERPLKSSPSTIGKSFSMGSTDPSPVLLDRPSPVLKEKTMGSPTGSPVFFIVNNSAAVAQRLEQERRRARGSIYAARARDTSRCRQAALRLQSEIAQLNSELQELDAVIQDFKESDQTISIGHDGSRMDHSS